MWSIPSRVSPCLCNSYTLETLGGLPIDSTFSARHLHTFELKPGTKLTLEQLRRLERLDVPEDEDEEDGKVDAVGLGTLWSQTEGS